MVHYIHHADIDKHKWDRAVELSIGGMPYALSWYLDVVSPNWDAIIDDDYQIIMPVPVKRKYGLRYVIQPNFVQQLGIFSSQMTDSKTVQLFCRELISRFGYVILQFNYSNVSPGFTDLFPNYVLDLHRDYNELRSNFAENHRRNIRKVLQGRQLSVTTEAPPEQIEAFIHANDSFHGRISLLTQLSSIACEKGAGEWQVAVNSSGEIVSAIFWLKYRYRHIYLYSLSSSEGKSLQASFFLVNDYIRRYAGTTVLIDFEGSHIPGIARFFAGFGSRLEYYPILRYRNVWKLILHSLVPA